MKKTFVSSLCALLWMGCGESPTPAETQAPTASTAEQALPCADCDTGLAVADVPGTHGYEIELPIWQGNFVPPEWEVYCPETVGCLIRPLGGASVANMDWRGGNVLYNVQETHLPYLAAGLAQGNGYQVLGHVTGFFTNIQPGKVRGSVQFETSPGDLRPNVQDEVVLALQTHDGTAWTDAAIRNLPLSVFFYGEVEAQLSPNTPVRMEIRMRQRPDWPRSAYFTAVRLFGAQCYPDFSNNATCL
ncbi:hypothetical protein MYSTI_05432 [Myxococcus stipitatus DSM 14675]|uniref:Lipoprotein n=1 Tax=Myxococcus stipitatus (strain DSM 14675 / JCM 12634 / Mx s8) TaxID=1278073 RepID=L7UCS8_MYXSD|nr:hypothetical protein [Myxococcus stipitatus]AGC46711.1 hypothetical protein MYSTI_05432 [Myxococcus stipitatus DSM 14675]